MRVLLCTSCARPSCLALASSATGILHITAPWKLWKHTHQVYITISNRRSSVWHWAMCVVVITSREVINQWPSFHKPSTKPWNRLEPPGAALGLAVAWRAQQCFIPWYCTSTASGDTYPCAVLSSPITNVTLVYSFLFLFYIFVFLHLSLCSLSVYRGSWRMYVVPWHCTTAVYLVQRGCLCRSCVTTELVSL